MSGDRTPIVEDYSAIAKRLRELQAAAPKSVDEIGELERWRDAARDVARVYVQNRQRRVLPRKILPQPTD